MPIASFSSSEATRSLRRNPNGIWPDGRKRGWRLNGIATIEPRPTFTFSRDDLIMTIGSCFAREIEKVLAELGFLLPTRELEIPADERITSVANDILNKYTVHSMVNEIEWAFSPPDVPPTDLFVAAGNDLWHDPHLVHTLKPSSLERVVERREAVLKTMRRLPECRIVVVTLGLAEAWFDRKLGVYLNSAPPQPAMAAEPDRFRLDVLSYEDITEGIERLLALLKSYGHPGHRVLMTVSPVPFQATFTGQDALAANTYSKAVQRAAVEAAVRRHDNVDYFPSYETVTLTDRKVAYFVDNIHVNPEVVAEIMRRVVAAYVPGLELAPAGPSIAVDKSRDEFGFRNVLGEGHAALDRGDYFIASSHFSSVLHRFQELPPQYSSAAYSGLVQAMLLGGQIEEALRIAGLWRAADPSNAQAAATMSKVLVQFDKRDDAIAVAKLACDLSPQEGVYRLRLASLYLRYDQPDAARDAATKALALDPSLDGATEILLATEAALAQSSPDRAQTDVMG